MNAMQNNEAHECDICGRTSVNCVCYDMRGNGFMYICSHCLISSKSPEVEFAKTYGKLLRNSK